MMTTTTGEEKTLRRSVLVNTKPQTVCCLAKQQARALWFGSFSLPLTRIKARQGMCVNLSHSDILYTADSECDFMLSKKKKTTTKTDSTVTLCVWSDVCESNGETQRRMHTSMNNKISSFLHDFVEVVHHIWPDEKRRVMNVTCCFSNPSSTDRAFFRICLPLSAARTEPGPVLTIQN